MYLVIEIQTNADGTIGTIITQHATQNEAESKYHTVLAAAALSHLPVHAAVLCTNYGSVLMAQHYTYEEPSPEPEPEEAE